MKSALLLVAVAVLVSGCASAPAPSPEVAKANDARNVGHCVAENWVIPPPLTQRRRHGRDDVMQPPAATSPDAADIEKACQ